MRHNSSSRKRTHRFFDRRAGGLVTIVALLVAAAALAGTASSDTAARHQDKGVHVPAVKPSDYSISFAVMSKFKALERAGHGLVGVILPDTTTSTRYVEFDAPFLAKAFRLAGYPKSDYVITNAQGSDATELAMAQSDITKGAKVLIVDPLDPTVGVEIEHYAASHGVPVIAYDRAIFAGTHTYWASFNGTTVGRLIGQGFQKCVTAWGVKHPQVFVLDGGENTDPNAIAFANGYNKVIWGTSATPLKPPMTNHRGYTLVGDQVATSWDVPTGSTIFAQQFTAHPNINAVVTPNDDLANAVIQDLKAKGVGPHKIPTTGQDGTLQGMENILEGYQCGSVLKPEFLEAQDAVALATILRAHATPPHSLINATAVDPANSKIKEPASLVTPVWVTPANMAKTVIRDGFIPASTLCTAVGSKLCAQHGIKP